MTMLRFSWLAAALVVLAWTSASSAHPVGVSQGEYVLADGTIYAGVTFARRELADALPWLRTGDDRSGVFAFEEHREALGRWVLERLALSSPSGPCRGSFDGMRFDGDGIAFALSFACPNIEQRLDLDARFVTELDRGHRHLAALSIGNDRRETVASRAQTQVSFDWGTTETPGGATARSAPGPRSLVAPLLRMGIEHILTGYDHLLFLLGLVLVGGPIRSLVGAITAFTVAHSVTLAVAALGLWTPDPRIIEPCIALSIAYVGAENWFVRDARGRFRVTFPFGLLHGFGFAGALREIALPRGDLPLALLAFNMGVEIGQLMILVVVVPLVLLARKKDVWAHGGMRACTAAIALAGVVWFIVRLRTSI
jgi:hypothetical protein